jgi:hypothetical protein
MLGRRNPAHAKPRTIAAHRRAPRRPIPVACDLAIAFRPPRRRVGRQRRYGRAFSEPSERLVAVVPEAMAAPKKSARKTAAAAA